MGDKKRCLTCPGILIDTEVDRENSKIRHIFGKSRPGDEFWFFQGKRLDGTIAIPTIVPVRDNGGMWVGMSCSQEELCSVFTASCAKTEDGMKSLLWILMIVIGMVSGHETSVDFNPPKLDPECDSPAPGERIAILRIGEMKIKSDEQDDQDW